MSIDALIALGVAVAGLIAFAIAMGRREKAAIRAMGVADHSAALLQRQGTCLRWSVARRALLDRRGCGSHRLHLGRRLVRGRLRPELGL